VRRAEALREVLVIHDSTEFKVKVHNEEVREHLCRSSKNRQGFFGHASLVTSADGLRIPLGLVGFRPYVHSKHLDSEDSRQWWDERGGVMASEQERWHDSVANADKALRRVDAVIHVMDREADDYDLVADMLGRGDRFIVRSAQDRRVKQPDGTVSKLSAALEMAPFVATRTVELSAREMADRPPDNVLSHPPRKRRDATLSFRARSIVVLRPDGASDQWPKSLRLNVVEAVELSPPDGEAPVRWVLLTTDPVDTVDDILLVVDRYRARWLVEEFFKALKTGCAYEKRQMESAATLLVVLAISLPVAWHLLLLRHVSRNEPEAPAWAVVTPTQLRLLEIAVPKWKWSESPTAEEACLAIARLGGHLKDNGAPGWLVLGRGYRKLLDLEAALGLLRQAGELPSDRGPSKPEATDGG